MSHNEMREHIIICPKSLNGQGSKMGQEYIKGLLLIISLMVAMEITKADKPHLITSSLRCILSILKITKVKLNSTRKMFMVCSLCGWEIYWKII